MTNFRILPLAALTAALFLPQAANSQEAGCSKLLAQRLAPEMNSIAWVLTSRANVPVFADATSTSNPKALEFSRNLRAMEVQGGRVKIKDAGTAQDLGWVDMTGLVCNDRPLMIRGRLERKVFIRPPRTVTAPGRRPEFYASATPGTACQRSTPGCAEVQWFGRYFVYAEQVPPGQKEPWVLLAPVPSLNGSSPLIGWVPKSNVLEWSTFFGLRPPTADLAVGEKPFICAFPRREDALKPPQGNAPPAGCIEVSTGPRWESTNDPLPVLDEMRPLPTSDDPAAPAVAFRVATIMNEHRELTVQPTVPQRETISALDVVFAIDATMSMGHYIRAIATDFVPKVTAALSNANGLPVRFGWVVYRDLGLENPQGSPLASKPLPSDCNTNDNDAAQSSLRQVLASTSDQAANDDEWEDVAGGITRASAMLKASCSNHAKVLVVVGDAGGRPADRTARLGNIAGMFDALRMKSPFFVFFARTPVNAEKQGRAQYEQAYSDFNEEAAAILQQMAKTNWLQTSRTADTNHEILRASRADEVVSNIVASIKAYNRSPAPDIDIHRQTQAGVPLLEAYKTVMEQYPDIPARRFTNSFEADCRALVNNNPDMAARKEAALHSGRSDSEAYTEICSSSSIISVEEAYMRWGNSPIYSRRQGHGDQTTIDLVPVPPRDNNQPRGKDETTTTVVVRLTVPQLNEWVVRLNSLLNAVRNAANKSGSLIRARAELISHIVGQDPQWDPSKETIQNYMLRAGGFPVSSASPLLAYSDYQRERGGAFRNELQDATNDEVNRLVEWLNSSHKLLSTVNQTDRPLYRMERYSDQAAGGSPNLHEIPRVVQTSREKFAPGRGYCHSSDQENETVCWVPQEILP